MMPFFIRQIVALLFLVSVSTPLFSQWSNGQAAYIVIGQADFTSSNTTQISYPTDVAVSKVTGKIFIADYGNNRILRYANTAGYVNGQAAELVLSNLSTAGSFSAPQAIFVDQADNLWVADSNNNRVLCFSDASNLTNNTLPTKVLGQANFTTMTAGNTLNKMITPSAIFVDGIRDILWVVDKYNHRVLRFDQISSKTSGSSADMYLGTETTGTSATQFNTPNDLYVDNNGNLWITDTGNYRVLRFSNAHTLTNGAAASNVLGQPNLTTASPSFSPTQRSLGSPLGIYGDNGGRIYVTDRDSHRILVFKNAALLGNNAPADFVIGQPNFTSWAGFAPSQTSLFTPYGIFVDDNLWVADAANNRVLKYEPTGVLPVSLTSFSVQSQQAGKIEVQWETANEKDNSFFELHVSTDGKTFIKAAEIAAGTENGNADTPLKYSHTLNLNSQLALAGFGLLGLLLLPALRNRMMKICIVVLVVSALISCVKDNDLSTEKTVYIKLVQVDYNGTTTELGIKPIKTQVLN